MLEFRVEFVERLIVILEKIIDDLEVELKCIREVFLNIKYVGLDFVRFDGGVEFFYFRI